MYWWDYHALAQDLKNHTLSSREKFKYLLAIMLYVPTGLMGSNWIPGIYRFIYRLTNDILTTQAPAVPALKIFNDFNYFTDMVTIGIIGFGLLICYIANKRGDGRNFIGRFMCLSIPITIRVSTYVLCVFLIIMGTSLFYFYFKLQVIVNIHGLFKAFKQLRYLKQLTPIMAYISFRMHIFSCALSLLSLFLNFVLLRREIAYVAKPHTHSPITK